MRTEATQTQASERLHQHYTLWFTGDGARTEFGLERTYGRLDDVHVSVNGSVKRPDDQGTAHDYKLRGLTAGYDGEKNMIKFAAAPGAGQHVCVQVSST